MQSTERILNTFVDYLTDTRMATCEKMNCENNIIGKCALRQTMIKEDGTCGWMLLKKDS